MGIVVLYLASEIEDFRRVCNLCPPRTIGHSFRIQAITSASTAHQHYVGNWVIIVIRV